MFSVARKNCMDGFSPLDGVEGDPFHGEDEIAIFRLR